MPESSNDVSIDDSQATQPDVSPEVLSNIADVMGRAEGEEATLANDGQFTPSTPMEAKPTDGQSPLSPKPAASQPMAPRSAKALKREAKQQQEELEEEGLEGDGEAAVEDEPAEEEPEQADEEEEAAPEIDPTLKGIAIEFGWTEEQLNVLAKDNPELLEQTLQNVAVAYANLSRVNPAASGPAYSPAQQQAAPAAQGQPNALDALYTPDGLRQFAEVNGDDMVEKLLKPLGQELHELRAMRNEYMAEKATLAAQERQAIASEANGVFEKLSESYSNVYGKGPVLNQAQSASRQHVAQLADQLRSGARLQGRELSVTEALKRAHLIETAELRVADGRKQVQQSVQRRSRQISARPTQRNSVNQATGQKTESSAAEAYERRAAELGIEV